MFDRVTKTLREVVVRGMRYLSMVIGLLCIGTAALGAINAWGDEDLGEIVVTARRKAENLERVPVAVTAVLPEKLEDMGPITTDELNKIAPSLHVYGQNAQHDQLVLSIRGEGLTYNTLFPAVIPYLAEVPVPNLMTGAFFDLENVQVLRGPQGVRFGRVTDGGAVLLQPKLPTNDFGGYVGAGAGDYRMHSEAAAVNLPIIDGRLLLRISGESDRRDGYVRNVTTGQDLDNLHSDSARVGLLFKPTEALQNYTMFQYQHVESLGTGLFFTSMDPAYFTPAFAATLRAAYALQQQLNSQYGEGFAVSNAPHPPDDRKHYYVINKTTWDISDSLQVKNIASYSLEKDYQYPTSDPTDDHLIGFVPVNDAPYLNKYQVTEELQLNGKALEDAVNWTVGAYADRQQPNGRTGYGVELYDSIVNNVSAFILSQEKALYASSELDLGHWNIPGLKLNAGIRQSWDKESVCQAEYLTALGTNTPAGTCVGFTDLYSGPLPAANHEESFKKTTYELGASYQLTPNEFLYFTNKEGYRPGGFNLSSEGSPSSYGPESLMEFELGSKTLWKVGSVQGRTNIALFHDLLEHAQRNLNYVVPGGSGAIDNSVLNAATAHIYGVELENTVQLLEGLEINLSYAYTDSYYDNPLTPAQYVAACTETPVQPSIGFCPANLINDAPRNQVIGGINYTLPLADMIGKLSAGMNVDYRSTVSLNDYSALDPSQIVRGYKQFDFNTGWKSIAGSHVDLVGFVTNAFDNRSAQSTDPLLHQAGFGFGSYTYNYPRFYGFRVRYTFGAG
jgi:iron complex outermembrane receptor protein